jgi:hypothetical protein
MSHTQLPWRRVDAKIYGADNQPVARAWHDRDAIERDGNAAFIVEAVNSHDRLTAEVGRLREALKPFTHPDFRKVMSNNVEGADSPIFGREGAILTLGDFERAAKALNPEEPK